MVLLGRIYKVVTLALQPLSGASDVSQKVGWIATVIVLAGIYAARHTLERYVQSSHDSFFAIAFGVALLLMFMAALQLQRGLDERAVAFTASLHGVCDLYLRDRDLEFCFGLKFENSSAQPVTVKSVQPVFYLDWILFKRRLQVTTRDRTVLQAQGNQLLAFHDRDGIISPIGLSPLYAFSQIDTCQFQSQLSRRLKFAIEITSVGRPPLIIKTRINWSDIPASISQTETVAAL